MYPCWRKEYPYLAQATGNTGEEFRKERRLTKSALEEFAWFDRRYLCEIGRGREKTTVNAIYGICVAPRVSPVEFFRLGEDERMKLAGS